MYPKLSAKELLYKVSELEKFTHAQFKSIIEITHTVVISLDVNGNIVDCNKRIKSLIGYTRNEVIGKSILDFVHHEYIQKGKDSINEVFQKGYKLEHTYKFIHKNGSIIDVLIYTALMNASKMRTIRTIGFVYDITQVRRSEEELSIKNEAISSSINAIAFTDLRGTIQDVNHSFICIWNYKSEKELISKSIFNTWHGTENYKVILNAIINKGSWHGSIEAIKADETSFIAQMSASLVKSKGKEIGIMFSFIDITEEKQKELELKKFRTIYENVLDTVNEWIWETDKDSNYTYVSPKAFDILGYLPDELIGKHYSIIIPKEEQKTQVAYLRKLRENKQPIKSFVRSLLRKDGSIVRVETNALPYFKPNGVLLGYRGTNRDITDSLDMQEQLFQSVVESSKRKLEITALLNGVNAILNPVDLNESVKTIFKYCKDLVGAKLGYITLLDKDKQNELFLISNLKEDKSNLKGVFLPINGLIELAYRTQKTIYNNDFKNSEYYQSIPQNHVPLDNVLIASICVVNEPIGQLVLGLKPGGFDDSDASTAEAFCKLIAIALQNKSLKK